MYFTLISGSSTAAFQGPQKNFGLLGSPTRSLLVLLDSSAFKRSSSSSAKAHLQRDNV